MVVTRTELKRSVLREWGYTRWEMTLSKKDRQTWRENMFYRALRNLQRKGEIGLVSVPIPGAPGRSILGYRLTPEGLRVLMYHSLSQ